MHCEEDANNESMKLSALYIALWAGVSSSAQFFPSPWRSKAVECHIYGLISNMQFMDLKAAVNLPQCFALRWFVSSSRKLCVFPGQITEIFKVSWKQSGTKECCRGSANGVCQLWTLWSTLIPWVWCNYGFGFISLILIHIGTCGT